MKRNFPSVLCTKKTSRPLGDIHLQRYLLQMTGCLLAMVTFAIILVLITYRDVLFPCFESCKSDAATDDSKEDEIPSDV